MAMPTRRLKRPTRAPAQPAMNPAAMNPAAILEIVEWLSGEN